MKTRFISYLPYALLIIFLSSQNKTIALNSPLPNNNAIKEKVLLVTDRDLYLSGEKILFIANVIVEDRDTEDKLSNILYIEIFKEGKVFIQKKFRIEDGLVKGYIQLPDELLSANYYLRAYTMFMRNGEAENFFNTLIRVVNPERKLEESYTKQQRPIIISPEGGEFIDGIKANTSVIFDKRTYASVKNAIIVNGQNDTLSEISMYKNGLGSFSFIPKENTDYWMKLLLKTGDSVFIKLKESKKSGIILSYNRRQNLLELSAKGELEKTKVTLSIFNTYFEENASKEVIIEDSVNNIFFSEDSFVEGINYIICKKENGDIIFVKPIFIEPQRDSKIDFDIGLTTFDKREKVIIDVKGVNKDELLIYSVVKSGLFISNSDYLSKEFVFNPLLLIDNSYKVDNFTDEIINQIQLSFIFSHNRFNTQEFKNKFRPSTIQKTWLPEIRDLSIAGTIRNKENKSPLAGIMVYASVLGGQAQIHSYLSDENGNFIFSLNQLEGINDIGITMDSIENVDAEIVILSDFSKRFPEFNYFPLQIDSAYKNVLEEMYRNQQIGFKFTEVVLSHENYLDTIPFPFQDVQASIVLSDFIELPTMQEVFNEIVTYVSARKRGGKYVLNVLNKRTETLYDKPLVLIDKLVVFNIDKLMKMNPLIIEKIEVITKPYSFGEMTFNGIIMLTTKTDNFGGLSLNNETVFLKYQTATLSSEQLFPNFNTDNITTNQPYFSNTIFWESDIASHQSGIKKTFYTSDESGMFEVLIKVIKPGEFVQQAELLFNVE